MLEEVLDALERGGCQPRRSGSSWQARCPAHDDTTPSLSVSRGAKQEVLLHCHAGCRFKDVLEALGLGPHDPPAAGLQVMKPASVAGRELKPKPLPSGRGLTSWVYKDADGKSVLAVVRRDGQNGKRFSQWTPFGGGWVPGGLSSMRPLYRLPVLLTSNSRVAVVEGKKCVDACLAAWPDRQQMTTWSGGTANWRKTDWSPLAGREVSLLADADEAGRKAVREIAAHLAGLGCNVRVGFPEGDDGEDIADWLEAEGVEETAARVGTLLVDYRPGLDAPGSPPCESGWGGGCSRGRTCRCRTPARAQGSSVRSRAAPLRAARYGARHCRSPRRCSA